MWWAPLTDGAQATTWLKRNAKHGPKYSQFEDVDRLKCIDKLLQEMAETPDLAQPQGSNWIISETTSPVDYRPQITALTTARASSKDAPSSLAIHCHARRMELTISTTGSWKQATDGQVKAVCRINEEPSVEQRWRVEETGRSLTFPGDIVRLLRSMPDSGQMLVEAYAGKGPPRESAFQLVGLDSVRRKIAADRRRSRPSPAHLRSFTCKAYAELPAQAANATEPRSFTMIVDQSHRPENMIPGRMPAQWPAACRLTLRQTSKFLGSRVPA